jgi:hypothetical protein
MIWDFAILWLILSLAVAGWNLGVVNAWPMPVAMLLSTAITQMFYGNFSAWLLDQSHLPGALAFFLGYILLWLAIELTLEGCLVLLIPIRKRFTISRLNRSVGALAGFSKAAIVILFATAASVTAGRVSDLEAPGPPLVTWLGDSRHESVLLHKSARLAAQMPAALANKVISHDTPTYEPPVVEPDVSDERKEELGLIFHTLHDLVSQL